MKNCSAFNGAKPTDYFEAGNATDLLLPAQGEPFPTPCAAPIPDLPAACKAKPQEKSEMRIRPRGAGSQSGDSAQANNAALTFENQATEDADSSVTFAEDHLIRLCSRKGEYTYARPADIVMLESCDHLVKVYIIHEDKIKKTIRCSTLKDFLSRLPQNQFMRIGRFCAINLKRLSGGDYNQQTFEFDFRISIKLKHPIPFTNFNNIGI